VSARLVHRRPTDHQDHVWLIARGIDSAKGGIWADLGAGTEGPGTATFRFAVEVDAAGTTVTHSGGTIDVRDPYGTPLFPAGPFDILSSTRVTFDVNPATDSTVTEAPPAAATPTTKRRSRRITATGREGSATGPRRAMADRPRLQTTYRLSEPGHAPTHPAPPGIDSYDLASALARGGLAAAPGAAVVNRDDVVYRFLPGLAFPLLLVAVFAALWLGLGLITARRLVRAAVALAGTGVAGGLVLLIVWAQASGS